MTTDFNKDLTAKTLATLKRALEYSELAEKNGDAAHIETQYGTTKVIIEIQGKKVKNE